MTPDIEIVEVSPRDGLQNHPTLLSTPNKFKRMKVQTGYTLERLIAEADWLAERLGGAPSPTTLGRPGVFPPQDAGPRADG